MCELLGLSFNLPVRPTVSFRGFRARGGRNPEGWGLAFYPGKSAQIYKEPIEAGESAMAKFLLSYEHLQSNIFIAHVRLASTGAQSHQNTHPFSREVHRSEYVFAHNGTLGTAHQEVLSRDAV